MRIGVGIKVLTVERQAQHNPFFFLGQKSCPGSLNFIHPNLMLLHFMFSVASTFLTAADDLCLVSAVL